MNWLPLQSAAQFSVEHILNVLPEGLLIALFAWGLLRVLRGQNSGTRFAVWFLALLGIAALPLLSLVGNGHKIFGAGMASGSTWGSMHPAINLPARWAVFGFMIWAFGAALAMARLLSGLWRLGRLRRSCTAVDAVNFDRSLRTTVEAIGASGATVASSESVRVPAAIGFWKRTIVLPAWTLREMAAEAGLAGHLGPVHSAAADLRERHCHDAAAAQATQVVAAASPLPHVGSPNNRS